MASSDRPGDLIDELRKLTAEETALARLIEKAASKARDVDAARLQEHRRELGKLRVRIEAKQRAAIAARDRLVTEINGLRHEALEVRRNIEELRDQVRAGGLSTGRVVEFSSELQLRYRQIFDSLSRREFELSALHELLPGAREARKLPPVNALDPPSLIFEPLLAGTIEPSAAVFERLPARGGAPPPPAARVKPPPVAPPPPIRMPPHAPPASAAPVPAPSAPAGRGRGRKRRKPAEGVDRQIHVRYPFVTHVRCRAGRKVVVARSADVSRGGMFIEGRPTLTPGTPMSVVFAVEGFPLEIESYVAYETPDLGMGVRFHHVDPVDQPHLERLIALLEAERSSDPPSGG